MRNAMLTIPFPARRAKKQIVTIQLDDSVDFKKLSNENIFIRKSVPIQPKTVRTCQFVSPIRQYVPNVSSETVGQAKKVLTRLCAGRSRR